MKKKKYFVMFLVILFLFVVGVYLCAEYYSDKYSNNVLRLHIIANSNTVEDQALKLKVRDCIGEKIDDFSKEALNASDMERIIKENSDEIKSAAQKCIEKEGYNYNVEIEIGNFYFPTKYVGGEALPAGEYDAIRIIIGEGKGENWWCILFPPLSFSSGIAKDETKSDFEGNAEEKVNIKFKFVEIFQEVKYRLSNLLDF